MEASSNSFNGFGRTLNALPKLEGQKNFLVWKVQLELALVSLGLWRYITGSKKSLVKGQLTAAEAARASIETNSTTATLRAAETADDFEDRNQEFIRNDGSAKAAICANVTNSILLSLRKYATSKEMIDYLNRLYEPDSILYIMNAYFAFQSLKFDGNNIQSFCTKYVNSVSLLAEAGIDFESKLALFTFIYHISPFYDNWTTNIRQQLRTTWSEKGSLPLLDTVIADLLDEVRSKQSGPSTALVAQKQEKGNKDKGNKNKDKICNYCNKKGHVKDECF